MVLTGTIREISNEIQTVGNSKIREFEIEEVNERMPQYNNFFLLKLVNKHVSLIDNFKVNDTVNVSCAIKSKKYIVEEKRKFAVTFEVYKIEKV